MHGLSVCCTSVTLVHPAKAVGRNEIPFGMDTRVVIIIMIIRPTDQIDCQNYRNRALESTSVGIFC